MEGFREIKLDDKEWGEVRILRVIPRGEDPWGVLRPLKDTLWGKLIPEVSGDVMTDAMHGYVTPLLREIGRDPLILPKRLQVIERRCRLSSGGTCDMFSHHTCVPGEGKLVFCYEAPLEDREKRVLASRVAAAWAEGKYVVVVVGDELSL